MGIYSLTDLCKNDLILDGIPYLFLSYINQEDYENEQSQTLNSGLYVDYFDNQINLSNYVAEISVLPE